MRDIRLMQKAVNNERVVPMRLGASILVMTGDVIEVAVATGKEASTKPTRPGLFAACVLNDAVGMRTCGAAMCILVVLVEGVGTPKDAIAVGARIALVAFMEFVLVSLPVKFALKSNIAKCAPVSTLRFGCTTVVALYRRRGRRRERRHILRYLG